jgi:hypothetical protein
LAFWFGGTVGKNFEERVVVLQFCFNSRGEILVADSSFFFFSPQRETPDTCSSETQFNAEASGVEHPPTSVYQVREEKENPSLERPRPTARPPFFAVNHWEEGEEGEESIHTSMFRNHVLGFRIHHCSKNSQLPK